MATEFCSRNLDIKNGKYNGWTYVQCFIEVNYRWFRLDNCYAVLLVMATRQNSGSKYAENEPLRGY